MPSDGAGESVVFLEVAPFGDGQVAGFDQSVIIGGDTGLLGDSIKKVGGSDDGRGGFGLSGWCDEVQR